MHSRRPGVSPLAIVLPHPPLPSRRSSLLSTNSASGLQTPPAGVSPNCSAIFFTPSRKSTDSWNSSNADELEWEWKADQVLLLSRTLDALPAHILTPFNGPIPPPNLLDKIARGVSTAKGPVDWPHSIRATRVKLIELARSKAKEEALVDRRRQVIAEEPEVEIDDGSNYSYLHDGAERPLTIGARRPVYRQSSMDFIKPVGTDIKDNDNVARLSRRLQRTDRAFPSPAFHPYARASRANPNRRSTSPPLLANVPSLISPSTESSDTVNSISSFSSELRMRRSISSLSSISMNSGSSIPDPRLQRIRSESISCRPLRVPSKDGVKSSVGLKRAPSYGALAQEARREHITSPSHVRRDSGSYPSSDEEEKARTKHAKKLKTRAISKTAVSSPGSPASQRPSSPLPPPVPEKDKKHLKTRTTKSSPAPVQDENAKIVPSSAHSRTRKMSKVDGSLGNREKTSSYKRPAPMNLQRNPSIFGPELPQVHKISSQPTTPLSPAKPRGFVNTQTKIRTPSSSPLSPSSTLALSPSAYITPSSPASPPPTQRVKTLRRVQRLIPARRISFGSLLSGGGDDMDLTYEGNCLGSAFQLI